VLVRVGAGVRGVPRQRRLTSTDEGREEVLTLASLLCRNAPDRGLPAPPSAQPTRKASQWDEVL
jgi:hypothetical protein